MSQVIVISDVSGTYSLQANIVECVESDITFAHM